MKFRLRKGKGSVSGFTDAEGVTHVPGDVVDLQASYKGQKWLEVVNNPVAKPMVLVAPKVEEPKEESNVTESVPLPEKTEKEAIKEKIMVGIPLTRPGYHGMFRGRVVGAIAVSYTHLTLPTILLV